jgi:hypothetical protein
MDMKRIFALLVCALVLATCNTAEARRNGRRSGGNYYRPVQAAPMTYQTATTTYQPTMAYKVVTPAATQPTQSAKAAAASLTTSPAPAVQASPVSFSTATAQGVANIMASYGRVGHWGGNPGYEGCGMGATPQAAYNTCCYANSGMATVDVGYAQGRNGYWYCCRRYR